MKARLNNVAKNERPNIKLSVQRVEANVWTELGFDKHHYLTASLNKSAKCFLFYWNDKVVGFCAALNMPRRNQANGCAISRVVVYPDFQGMGIGVKIVNFIGGIYKNSGYRMFIKTVNPALGVYFDNHPSEWKPTQNNHKGRTLESISTDRKAHNHLLRVSYSHEYVGKDISGYEDMLLPIDVLRNNKVNNNK